MKSTKRIPYAARGALLLLLAVLAALALPLAAHARESEKFVRVGWFESPFNTTDELGRRSGYAYDYQQKIAACTGWTYEYVSGLTRPNKSIYPGHKPKRPDQTIFPLLPNHNPYQHNTI